MWNIWREKQTVLLLLPRMNSNSIYMFRGPRLVIHTLLCLGEESLVLMGPDCGSWGMPARGTSQRSYINPCGLGHLPFVEEGNLCISRSSGNIFIEDFRYYMFEILGCPQYWKLEPLTSAWSCPHSAEGGDALFHSCGTALLLCFGAPITDFT